MADAVSLDTGSNLAGRSDGRIVGGRYELITRIASGGMATVYLGRARGLGNFARTVAIKCCHPHLRDDEEFALMFLDEAQLAARIHHPNVVATLDVGRDDVLFLVMEYIEGERLSDLVKAANDQNERLPVEVVLRIMVDALTGLHAAHELRGDDGQLLGLIHRDVSPQNILVGADGITRLADFGIAKAASRATVTRTGQVKGKLSYMAPEQFRSDEITTKADVFAAGVVLWEALTGKRLFRGDNDAQTTARVLHAPIPPPSTVVPELAGELERVVMKALERTPDTRFASAQAFSEALESLSVRVAPPREVARCLERLMGDRLEQRRRSLKSSIDGASSDSRPSIVRPAPDADVDSRVATQPVGTTPVDHELSIVTEEGPPQMVSLTTVTRGTTDVSQAALPTRRTPWALLAIVALVAMVGVGVLLLRGNTPSSANAATPATTSGAGARTNNSAQTPPTPAPTTIPAMVNTDAAVAAAPAPTVEQTTDAGASTTATTTTTATVHPGGRPPRSSGRPRSSGGSAQSSSSRGGVVIPGGI